MPNPLMMYLSLSSQGVEEIEVLYPPGQREEAWKFCRECLPQVAKLDSDLGTRRENQLQSLGLEQCKIPTAPHAVPLSHSHPSHHPGDAHL
jgi:hypothetical protein